MKCMCYYILPVIVKYFRCCLDTLSIHVENSGQNGGRRGSMLECIITLSARYLNVDMVFSHISSTSLALERMKVLKSHCSKEMEIASQTLLAS